MSYTPPAGNSANLTFVTGYTAPAGNFANLFYVPTMVLVGSATVGFVGRSIASGAAAISGASTLSVFSVAIKGASLSVFGSTTLFFDPGYREWALSCGAVVSFSANALTSATFVAAANATAYFERYYPPPIQGVTTFAPVGGGVTPVYFYARGKSEGDFSASFEKQTKAVVSGRTIPSVKTNVIRPLLFSVNAAANPALVGRSIFQSFTGIHGAASLGGVLGGVQDTQTTIPSNSTTNFFVDRVGAGTANINGVAAVYSDGAYTTISVTPYNPENDTVFVTSKRQEVIARGL
jgi:hypothetical protein